MVVIGGDDGDCNGDRCLPHHATQACHRPRTHGIHGPTHDGAISVVQHDTVTTLLLRLLPVLVVVETEAEAW